MKVGNCPWALLAKRPDAFSPRLWFQTLTVLLGVKMAQQELIAQAFAGDDVAAAFEEGKEAEIQAELPKVEGPSLMPGWGTWASQQREPRWMVEARKKAEQ